MSIMRTATLAVFSVFIINLGHITRTICSSCNSESDNQLYITSGGVFIWIAIIFIRTTIGLEKRWITRTVHSYKNAWSYGTQHTKQFLLYHTPKSKYFIAQAPIIETISAITLLICGYMLIQPNPGNLTETSISLNLNLGISLTILTGITIGVYYRIWTQFILQDRRVMRLNQKIYRPKDEYTLLPFARYQIDYIILNCFIRISDCTISCKDRTYKARIENTHVTIDPQSINERTPFDLELIDQIVTKWILKTIQTKAANISSQELTSIGRASQEATIDFGLKVTWDGNATYHLNETS